MLHYIEIPNLIL